MTTYVFLLAHSKKAIPFSVSKSCSNVVAQLELAVMSKINSYSSEPQYRPSSKRCKLRSHWSPWNDTFIKHLQRIHLCNDYLNEKDRVCNDVTKNSLANK